MPDTSTILSLPYILPAQAQKHVTHNEALRQLDVIVQLAVTARNLAVPPVAPVQGDRYIVAAAASGDWAGKSGQIAMFDAGAWQFYAPVAGWTAWIAAETALASYNGSAWLTLADGPQRFPQLGVSATADATNRLTVSSPATLLNHAGAGHQLKLNKATATDTASLLFQTGFSGRAEMGTAGNDDFSIKVSADGSAFVTGLSIAGASGQVTLPAALRLGGQAADPVSPSNGMIWLNSTTGEVKVRSNGASIVIASVTGVANSQLANMAAASFKGRDTGSAGAPQDLTPVQAAALLPVVTSTARGLAPASGGGNTTFLRADGLWAVPAISGGLPSLGITASAAQINPLAAPVPNHFLAGDTGGNRATGAYEFGNNARWLPVATSSGITATRVGFGADFVDYTVAGTSTGAGSFPIYDGFAARVAATTGETLTASYLAQITTALPPAGCGPRVDLGGVNAAGTVVQYTASSATGLAAETLLTHTNVLSAAGIVTGYASVNIVTPAATTVNYTVRIRRLQLDSGTSRLVYPFKSLSPAEVRAALALPLDGNGRLPVSVTPPWAFTSSQQTITLGSTLTVAHGLGAKPTRWMLTMICTTADLGYAVGDEVTVPFVVTTLANGAVVNAATTNIVIRTAVNGILLMNASWAFAAATPASWRYIVRASL